MIFSEEKGFRVSYNLVKTKRHVYLYFIMRLMAWGDLAISEIWFVNCVAHFHSYLYRSEKNEFAVSCHLVPLVRVAWRAGSNFGASWWRHKVVSIREMDVQDSNEQNILWQCASQGCSCFSLPPEEILLRAKANGYVYRVHHEEDSKV